MIAAVGALAFVLLVVAAGSCLEDVLRADGPSRSMGRCWLLGCAAVSLALHVPLAIDGQLTQRWFAALGVALLAAGVWRLWRLGRAWIETAHGPNWPTASLFGRSWIGDLPRIARPVVLVAIALAASHALRSELSGYDARTAFALKARILYDTGTVTGEDFADIHRLNFNPSYPLLIPLVEAQMYWFQGTYQAPGLQLLFVCFSLAVVSVYAAEMRRFAPGWLAAGSACLLLITPMMIECFEGAGLSGSADLPLGAFVFAGTLELFRFCARPSARSGACAGLLLGAAMLTKQEGLLWVAVGCATALPSLLWQRRASRLIAVRALPGLAMLLLAAGLHLLAHRSMPSSPYYPSMAAAATDWHWLAQLTDRPAEVARYALAESVRTTRWGLLWLCIIGSLLLLNRGRVPAEVKCWRVVASLMLAVYLAAMVISPLHLQYQLSTTFSRLMLHLFPLALLIMAEQVAASEWVDELLGTSPSE